MGQDVDIVHPDSDLSGYALIMAPALTLMTPERTARLVEASAHARLVSGPRTVFRTVSGRTPEDGQSGDLTELFGASLLNFDSLVGLEIRLFCLYQIPDETFVSPVNQPLLRGNPHLQLHRPRERGNGCQCGGISRAKS